MIHRNKFIPIWFLTSLIIFSIYSIPPISRNPNLPLQNVLFPHIICNSGADLPLIINGNPELAAQASEGNGTVNNPYIIQNKQINVGGNGTCILIQNTNKYFTLKNCLLQNSGGTDPYKAGIYLRNVTFGYIFGNNFSGCRYGIFLSLWTMNNRFENNSISNGTYGIYSATWYSNQFIKNNLYKNGYGIYLSYSHGNWLVNNTAIENSCGFYLYHSTDNVLVNNSGNKNSDRGLSIGYDSINNTVTDNIFNYNKIYGIYLFQGANNNTLTHTIAMGSTYGIRIDHSSYNNLMYNLVKNNSYGIYLDYSNYNDIEWNTLINNEYGLYRRTEGTGNIIQNNIVHDKIFIDFNFLFIEIGVICAIGIIILMWKAKRLKLL